MIPLGAFWQYSGTKRNTREPFHKHKVGLLGTNVHHVGCRGKKKRYFSPLLCLLDDLFILFCFGFMFISLPFASGHDLDIVP